MLQTDSIVYTSLVNVVHTIGNISFYVTVHYSKQSSNRSESVSKLQECWWMHALHPSIRIEATVSVRRIISGMRHNSIKHKIKCYYIHGNGINVACIEMSGNTIILYYNVVLVLVLHTHVCICMYLRNLYSKVYVRQPHTIFVE